jgi:hypothetical protein
MKTLHWAGAQLLHPYSALKPSVTAAAAAAAAKTGHLDKYLSPQLTPHQGCQNSEPTSMFITINNPLVPCGMEWMCANWSVCCNYGNTMQCSVIAIGWQPQKYLCSASE